MRGQAWRLGSLTPSNVTALGLGQITLGKRSEPIASLPAPTAWLEHFVVYVCSKDALPMQQLGAAWPLLEHMGE